MPITVFHDTTARGNVKVFPMALIQERLWFLDQLEPDSAAYNMPIAIRLRGLLDVEVLERSLSAIVQRHEALRTTFGIMEGQPVQVIAPLLIVPLPVIDLRGFPEAEREVEVLRLATAEAQRPFDLTHGPLVRTTLLHLEAEVVLLLTMHRIVSDQWSLGVLFRELVTLYEAFSTGQSSPLPELPVQYADFAVWQRKVLQRDMLAEQLTYWKQQLAGSPAGLDLPTDHPRLAVPTSRGSMYDLRLPKALTSALKALSRQEGVTLEMTLVAAFQTLLHRYSGQDDLVIGTVTAGRTRAETETLIGCFATMLVLRTDLSGNPPFLELLERVRKVILEAQAHQDLPFEYLVKELQPERQLGQHPLFQVSLVLEPPLSALPSEWRLPQMEVETGTSKLDLTLELQDRPQGLFGRLQYSTILFDQATIARMAGHWQTLLEGVVADPTRRLAELPLLTEKERHQLLVEWNSTQIPYPKDTCVHHLFEAQVERTPQAVAVIFGDQQMTYRELNQRANQLAHHLQHLGVGPEVLVGICVERSLDIIVGLLGVLKAGGAYVPIDPGFPSERIAFMLEDAQAPVVVTQECLVEKLPERHLQLVCLDTDWQTIHQQSEANPINEVKREQLAYVMYTSGSTGQPKGVLIEHQALAAHCWAITQVYELRAEDCVLQFAAFTFDVSLEQILPTLLVGARLVVRGQEIWSPADLLCKVKDLRLTVINLSPPYWHHVLQEWIQVPDQLLGHQLRLMIVGGDRLLPEMLELWRQTPLRSVRLLNAYGPTETTITATIFDMRGDREQLLEKVPIGRPLPNRTIYILDSDGNLVPVGVTGELYIGGNLLARGYLHRPELTAERFIPDGFCQQPQARLYKTGDLVRYQPDGSIEFLGRLDHQVKIRGFRIELGEIEAVLSQHPAVRLAIVMAREDTPGNKRLTAYVELQKEQSTTAAELKSHLMKQVPAYMVPSALVLLERLPLTSNGKVDRRALPAPEPDRSVVEESYVAPRLPVEQQLVQIWEELLETRPIGIKDDFFELGGNSLLAGRLFDRMVQVYSKKLPLSTLFAGATIEHLARALVGESKAALPGETKIDGRAQLVVVQERGSRQPFFYLHGEWKGGGLYSRELARHLGPEQPFYLLEPYKFEGLALLPTFEEMAAAHIEAMRSIQAEGPYFLSGYCNGGLLAYEMSRQLQAQGQAVGLVLLMDPDFPARHGLVRSVISRICNLLRIGQEKQFEWFLSLQHVYRYLRFAHYRSSINTELLGSVEQSEPEGKESKASLASSSFRLKALLPRVETLRQDWSNIYGWLVSNYTPDLYPGKITFFWTSEEPWRSDGWQKVVKAKEGEVETYINPGNHISSRTEYLPVLAQRLRECLNKAQAN